jgi:hypothetical protein
MHRLKIPQGKTKRWVLSENMGNGKQNVEEKESQVPK